MNWYAGTNCGAVCNSGAVVLWGWAGGWMDGVGRRATNRSLETANQPFPLYLVVGPGREVRPDVHRRALDLVGEELVKGRLQRLRRRAVPAAGVRHKNQHLLLPLPARAHLLGFEWVYIYTYIHEADQHIIITLDGAPRPHTTPDTPQPPPKRTAPARRGCGPPSAAAVTWAVGTSVGMPGGRKDRIPPSTPCKAPGAAPFQAA